VRSTTLGGALIQKSSRELRRLRCRSAACPRRCSRRIDHHTKPAASQGRGCRKTVERLAALILRLPDPISTPSVDFHQQRVRDRDQDQATGVSQKTPPFASKRAIGQTESARRHGNASERGGHAESRRATTGCPVLRRDHCRVGDNPTAVADSTTAAGPSSRATCESHPRRVGDLPERETVRRRRRAGLRAAAALGGRGDG
jgi:hypothetical protein